MSSQKRKHKAAASVATVRIEVAESNPAANPIVVSFPGGLPPPPPPNDEDGDRDASSSSKKMPKFYWQRLSEKSKSGRRVVGQDQHCIYEAYARGLAYDDRRTKLCVGVYDRRRGVVTLHEAASKGTVFCLRQSVPSYNPATGGHHVETKPGDKNSAMNRTQVFEDFGSSKKRKVLRSQAANQVDIDNVVGAGESSAMVHQILSGQAMSESNQKAIEERKKAGADAESNRKTAADRAMEEARKLLLPEFDEHAVEPHKVYNAKAMAGNEAWTRIHKKVYACLKEHSGGDDEDAIEAVVQSIFEKDRVDFVIRNMRQVKPTTNKDAPFRLTCAVLVNYMVIFYNNNHRRRSLDAPKQSKTFYHGVPVEVAERCFELFTTGATGPSGKAHYVMTKSNKERAVIHILLLFMLAQGPTMKIVDLKKVADDLKLPVQDCGQLLRYAGCKITKKGSLMSAMLTTPLEFPSMSRGGPPKGGRR